MLKKIGKLITYFIITVIVCAGLQLLTAMIPQNAIAKQTTVSAEYLADQELFPFLGNHFFTRQDNYSDAILLDMMYLVDQSDLAKSVWQAGFYQGEYQEINEALVQVVSEDVTPNQEYMRYWHGSTTVLRPLLTFLNIRQIRILLGAIVLILIIASSMLLWKMQEKIAAVALILSSLAVHVWMVLTSIEYVTTFLVMAIAVFVLLFAEWRSRKRAGINNSPSSAIDKEVSAAQKMYPGKECFFLTVGIITCFVDFLTTETITFTIPVVLLFLLIYRKGQIRDIKDGILYFMRNGIAWLAGYAGMFLVKWGLVAGIFGRDKLVETLQHAGERMTGIVYLGNSNLDPVASGGQKVSAALWRNMGCLFPLGSDMNAGKGFLSFFGALFVCFLIAYFFKVSEIDWKQLVPLMMLGLLPYVRFLALSNHSYIHYYMTYRAQIITVFVVLYIVFAISAPGVQQIRKKKKPKKKRK